MSAGTYNPQTTDILDEQIDSSPILLHRLDAWKHAVSIVLNYAQMAYNTQSNYSNGLAKQHKAVSDMPSFNGSSVTGGTSPGSPATGTLQSSSSSSAASGGSPAITSAFQALAKQTDLLLQESEQTATQIKQSVIPQLEVLASDLEKHYKTLRSQGNKSYKEVEKHRETTMKHLESLGRTTSVAHTSQKPEVKSDPYILHRKVRSVAAEQIHKENQYAESNLNVQNNFGSLEQHIVEVLQNAVTSLNELTQRFGQNQASLSTRTDKQFAAINPSQEWSQFLRANSGYLVPDTGYQRDPSRVTFANSDAESTKPIIEGTLSRKGTVLKGHKPGYYVLTPAGFLHQFKSADYIQDAHPELSLYIPESEISGLPANGGGDLSFKIVSRDANKVLSPRHKYTFTTSSYEELVAWHTALSSGAGARSMANTVDTAEEDPGVSETYAGEPSSGPIPAGATGGPTETTTRQGYGGADIGLATPTNKLAEPELGSANPSSASTSAGGAGLGAGGAGLGAAGAGAGGLAGGLAGAGLGNQGFGGHQQGFDRGIAQPGQQLQSDFGSVGHDFSEPQQKLQGGGTLSGQHGSDPTKQFREGDLSSQANQFGSELSGEGSGLGDGFNRNATEFGGSSGQFQQGNLGQDAGQFQGGSGSSGAGLGAAGLGAAGLGAAGLGAAGHSSKNHAYNSLVDEGQQQYGSQPRSSYSTPQQYGSSTFDKQFGSDDKQNDTTTDKLRGLRLADEDSSLQHGQGGRFGEVPAATTTSSGNFDGIGPHSGGNATTRAPSGGYGTGTSGLSSIPTSPVGKYEGSAPIVGGSTTRSPGSEASSTQVSRGPSSASRASNVPHYQLSPSKRATLQSDRVDGTGVGGTFGAIPVNASDEGPAREVLEEHEEKLPQEQEVHHHHHLHLHHHKEPELVHKGHRHDPEEGLPESHVKPREDALASSSPSGPRYESAKPTMDAQGLTQSHAVYGSPRQQPTQEFEKKQPFADKIQARDVEYSKPDASAYPTIAAGNVNPVAGSKTSYGAPTAESNYSPTDSTRNAPHTSSSSGNNNIASRDVEFSHPRGSEMPSIAAGNTNPLLNSSTHYDAPSASRGSETSGGYASGIGSDRTTQRNQLNLSTIASGNTNPLLDSQTRYDAPGVSSTGGESNLRSRAEQQFARGDSSGAGAAGFSDLGSKTQKEPFTIVNKQDVPSSRGHARGPSFEAINHDTGSRLDPLSSKYGSGSAAAAGAGGGVAGYAAASHPSGSGYDQFQDARDSGFGQAGQSRGGAELNQNSGSGSTSHAQSGYGGAYQTQQSPGSTRVSGAGGNSFTAPGASEARGTSSAGYNDSSSYGQHSGGHSGAHSGAVGGAGVGGAGAAAAAGGSALGGSQGHHQQQGHHHHQQGYQQGYGEQQGTGQRGQSEHQQQNYGQQRGYQQQQYTQSAPNQQGLSKGDSEYRPYSHEQHGSQYGGNAGGYSQKDYSHLGPESGGDAEYVQGPGSGAGGAKNKGGSSGSKLGAAAGGFGALAGAAGAAGIPGGGEVSQATGALGNMSSGGIGSAVKNQIPGMGEVNQARNLASGNVGGLAKNEIPGANQASQFSNAANDIKGGGAGKKVESEGVKEAEKSAEKPSGLKKLANVFKS